MLTNRPSRPLYSIVAVLACVLAVFIGASIAVDAVSTTAGELAGWYKARAAIASETTDLSGRADYKERERHEGLEQRLQIKVRNGDPDTAYSVSFNGVPLGEVTTNAGGNGKLKLRTRQFIRNNDWEPFPENFPSIIEGDVIELGSATGAFEVR